MKSKCLFCYQSIDGPADFHEACSKAFFGSTNPPTLEYTRDEMSLLAKYVVERSISLPGVQAKLSMSLVEETKKENQNRLTIVGALGGNYILKPPTNDYPEMPQNEHLTMRLAELFGIKVVPSTLIRLKSGELAYLTKRIDRTQHGKKIHMLDMFQITEAFDKYKSSMEKVGKALDTYTSNTLLDKLFLFEVTVFCFLTGNNDMHLKNFSMIEENERWNLAPFYDLLNVSILLPEDTEELALTLGGKKRKLKKKDFDAFANNLGLTKTQTNRVYKRFKRKNSVAIKWIQNSFLSNESKEKYASLLNERYDTLEI